MALDSKAQSLEQTYLTGLLEVADGYEEAGQIDKAREALEAILKLKPDSEAVKSRLAKLDEAVFDANSHLVEVDVTKGWTATGIVVVKGEPIRFEADGTYRYIINETIGADGFTQRVCLKLALPFLREPLPLHRTVTRNTWPPPGGALPDGSLPGMRPATR